MTRADWLRVGEVASRFSPIRILPPASKPSATAPSPSTRPVAEVTWPSTGSPVAVTSIAPSGIGVSLVRPTSCRRSGADKAGRVNPAAEANIFGDPDAADELYGSGADVTVVGLDVTQRLRLSESDLKAMRDASVMDESSAPTNPADDPHNSKHGAFLHAISEFYMAFHVRTTGFRGIFMHDPAAVVLAFAPELFSTKRGRVRVATEGLCKGQTVLDTGDKLWSFPNAWGEGERPAIAVALDVDVEKVMALFRERFGIAT